MGSSIRLLTFQSKSVLEQILAKGIYEARMELCRESNDYRKDIAQLNGAIPIWCFSPVGTDTLILNKFNKEDFIDGTLFDRFRCEMSQPDRVALNDLVLLEIEVEQDIPKTGLTHNSYKGAVIIPNINKSNLVAVYKLHYDCEDNENTSESFYPSMKVVGIYKDYPLFVNDFKCKKLKKPHIVDGCEVVRLFRGCCTHDRESILTREFDEISWWSTSIRDAGHYYEGCCIQIDVLIDTSVEMEYVRDTAGALDNYTFGRAEMNCPKGSFWYSFDSNYLKNHIRKIKEVEPEFYDWDKEDDKDVEMENMKIF